MTRKDQIRNAYRTTGGQASFYDGMFGRISTSENMVLWFKFMKTCAAM